MALQFKIILDMLRVEPPKIFKRSRFEETKLLHKRVLQLTDENQGMINMPRVPLHMTISGRCDEYLIALSELRTNKLPATSHRSNGTVELHEIRPCSNSY